MNFKPRKYKTRILILALLVALMSILIYANEKTNQANEKNLKTSKIQKVNIIAERFNFTPSQIKVKAGTHLEITLTSDDTFHGFRIPSANINQIIPARGRGSVKVMFDAREKGSYAFECSRPCGAGHTMMRGVIIVE